MTEGFAQYSNKERVSGLMGQKIEIKCFADIRYLNSPEFKSFNEI